MPSPLPSLVGIAALALLACEGPPAPPPDAASDGGVDAGTRAPATFEVAAQLDVPRPMPEGYDHLVARLGGGVCALDADGAPPLDLFFPARSGESRLLLGRGDFAYEARTIDAGDALGCLAFDADLDGDTDLLVTGVGTIRLLLREGDAFVPSSLIDPAVGARDVYASAAAGDVDGDGDVDVVVAGFLDATDVPTGDCDPFPCAVLVSELPYLPNRVFLREGDAYRELADPGPLAADEPTLALGITDVDGDGRTEVYVGNDAGDTIRDRVLRWDGSAFADVSFDTGMAHDAAGHGIDTMGWTTGDVDGDLRMDHAVSPFEGYHTPVFVCGDDGWCEDRGRALGTWRAADTFRWGNALADLDLDGDVDLLEACGHVFTAAEGERGGFPVAHEQPPSLFVNEGDALVFGSLDLPSVAGRGLSVADLDDDGRLDFVISTSRGPATIVRSRAEGHFLRVRLEGPPENPDAIGATVVARSDGAAFVRRRVAGEGFLGSFDPRLHFGLPTGAPVELEVEWPSGERTTASAAADSETTLRHP